MRTYGVVPLRLRDQFHCAHGPGGSELIEADVEHALDEGAYLPVTTRSTGRDSADRESADVQRELFPEHPLEEGK